MSILMGSSGSGAGGHDIQNREGTDFEPRSKLKFLGAEVIDDENGDVTIISLRNIINSLSIVSEGLKNLNRSFYERGIEAFSKNVHMVKDSEGNIISIEEHCKDYDSETTFTKEGNTTTKVTNIVMKSGDFDYRVTVTKVEDETHIDISQSYVIIVKSTGEELSDFDSSIFEGSGIDISSITVDDNGDIEIEYEEGVYNIPGNKSISVDESGDLSISYDEEVKSDGNIVNSVTLDNDGGIVVNYEEDE